MDFSDLSSVITLQTMEEEINILSNCGMSSFTSNVGMLDKINFHEYKDA